MSNLFQSLKSFDAYPKLNDEFKVKTFGGAIISLVSISLILVLFFSELSLYLQVETHDHLLVDTTRGEKMRINFDVEFPHIPCSLLSLDAMDVSGSHQLDVSHHIKKQPLDRSGQPIGDEVRHELETSKPLKAEELAAFKEAVQNNQTGPAHIRAAAPIPKPKIDPTKQPGYCGPCYGAELHPQQCCNTCDAVRDAYRARGWALVELKNIEQCVAAGETQDVILNQLERGEGCRMHGFLQVNKVQGNVHFAPGKSFQSAHMHIHDLAAFPAHRFNVSHRIHQLSFGEHFPGRVNPLDQTEKMLDESQSGGMYMYYVKIVPTTYAPLHGSVVKTNQFSVTEHFRTVTGSQGQGLPGCFFFYEISPIMVKFTEQRKSLPHFLTQLCAILGGVFTVAGMVDRLIYTSFRHWRKVLCI